VEAHDGGAPAATVRRGIPEVTHGGMTGQDSADDGALHADPPPVDQTNFAEPARPCGREVVLHHGMDIRRREGVQIERILDRDPKGLVVDAQVLRS
jgi:hypothetical protein